jgi:hypothetical protein
MRKPQATSAPMRNSALPSPGETKLSKKACMNHILHAGFVAERP